MCHVLQVLSNFLMLFSTLRVFLIQILRLEMCVHFSSHPNHYYLWTNKW